MMATRHHMVNHGDGPVNQSSQLSIALHLAVNVSSNDKRKIEMKMSNGCANYNLLASAGNPGYGSVQLER